jgi:hypothetical protein
MKWQPQIFSEAVFMPSGLIKIKNLAARMEVPGLSENSK